MRHRFAVHSSRKSVMSLLLGMAIPAAASHRSTSTTSLLRALTVLSVLAALVSDAEGRHHIVCPTFSCGGLRNISYPFRQQGDPSGCGVQSYELACTDTDATIRIGSGTYKVLIINSTGSYFWVVDANLSMQSNCPIPRWDYHSGDAGNSHRSIEFLYSFYDDLTTFVNCSKRIENNGMYKPVPCLSTNSSFIYVMTGYLSSCAGSFEPSCSYLAKTPLGGPGMTMAPPENASYTDVVKFMTKGFALQFPYTFGDQGIGRCLKSSISDFRKEPRNDLGIRDRILDILIADGVFWSCLTEQLGSTTHNVVTRILIGIIQIGILYATLFLKCIHGICRFVLMPLAVFIFLAQKYWRKRISIDAVEKFLRIQQMLIPTRYAYTDMIAITNHFKEKLGQGGYGSVYKGVLLPGNIHVAIKMLGNTNCNGEEFISEVATIGKIHHVNVVRLIGFCSEETSRALVYEFMPHGSLEKYIFSSEKAFSWDKLNEIALGIARGINYLHQGCDMQIVHFDIKPHNILLDKNFVPKVADFGLAKLFPRDKSFMPLSAMRGTIGYIAPEMVSRSFGVASSKSDVYRFGMLLLEMAGGRRNADPHAGSSSQSYYPSLVYTQLSQQEDVGEIGERVDMHDLEKNLCIVGLWCIQMRPRDRPTKSEVIDMLEASVDGLQMPPRPFFCDEEVEGSYYVPCDLNARQEEGE